MNIRLSWAAAVAALATGFTLGLAGVPASAATSPASGKPAMGLNLWYAAGCNVTETLVLDEAKQLVSTGLAAAGYRYVNLDDCWMAAQRNANGALTWNTTDFPHGIPWLAAQIHAEGLEFGLYESIGPITCQKRPGSGGPTGRGGDHYQQDAKTFRAWGVDFAKIDDCGTKGWSYATLESDFKTFGDDLRAVSPNIVYSEELPICCIGKPNYNKSIADSSSISNMWRIAGDEPPSAPASKTILNRLAADLHLHGYARPYHWNDLDMLVTGVPAFHWTVADGESQMSVWAEEASPLLLSADISKLTAGKLRLSAAISQLTSAELAALKNPYMIAIDQSGQQSPKAIMSTNGSRIEALQKAYPGSGVAVLLANLGSSTAAGKFTLAGFGISSRTATLFNIWTGKTRKVDHLGYTLGAGKTALLRLR